MNRALTVLLALAVVASVRADFWSSVKDVGSDVGDFFENTFTNFKSLFADDQSMLEKNIDKLKGLLQTIKEQMDKLLPLASDTQKEAMNKVNGWYNDISAFKDKVVRDGEKGFAENKATWEDKVKTMFEDDHLQSLVALVNSSGNLFAPMLTIVCSVGVALYLNR
uniref:Uncharacterized protein n=1 Tax=Plectus sambesii TaxID=2011161 RepID=A0A914W7M7_9BILA